MDDMQRETVSQDVPTGSASHDSTGSAAPTARLLANPRRVRRA